MARPHPLVRFERQRRRPAHDLAFHNVAAGQPTRAYVGSEAEATTLATRALEAGRAQSATLRTYQNGASTTRRMTRQRMYWH